MYFLFIRVEETINVGAMVAAIIADTILRVDINLRAVSTFLWVVYAKVLFINDYCTQHIVVSSGEIKYLRTVINNFKFKGAWNFPTGIFNLSAEWPIS